MIENKKPIHANGHVQWAHGKFSKNRLVRLVLAAEFYAELVLLLINTKLLLTWQDLKQVETNTGYAYRVKDLFCHTQNLTGLLKASWETLKYSAKFLITALDKPFL